MRARAEHDHRQEPAGGPPSAGGLRRITRAELAECDGSRADKPVLIAYDGRVYDVSDSFMWQRGRHFWLRAGADLTDRMPESIHDARMLDRVPCVGVLVD
jgi:predicted heme/steroid binding protein